MTPDDDVDLARSRAEFEAKVRGTGARPPVSMPGGKGSPPALLTIGVIGTATLAVCAAALGGGLLYVPAAIPLATVVLVLLSRKVADGQNRW